MPRSPDTIAPDTEDNSEQRDEGAQAQDVANDALVRGTDLSEDSVKGGGSDRGAVIPDDVPDLVDKMEEMNRSGVIDNDAYAGEPMMDDEEGWLGNTEGDDED
ncbi:MAG TPA: hypothetical protein VF509_13500 [Sphingobium sp.]